MSETSTYEWRYAGEDMPIHCSCCHSPAPTVERLGVRPHGRWFLCRFCDETDLGAILGRDGDYTDMHRVLARGLCQAFNLLDNAPAPRVDLSRLTPTEIINLITKGTAGG